MKLIVRSHAPRPAPLGHPEDDRSRTRRARSRGQVLVLFAGAAFVLFAVTALVIDVSWYWANTLKVQRAADAAALAGVVWLPGSPTTARTTAAAAAGQNGYGFTSSCKADNKTPSSVPGLCANPAPNNDRRLNVTISAPVGTFFMRIIGIPTITATRDSQAEFILPVPMGSPENYYGVFGILRGATFTSGGMTTTNNLLEGPGAPCPNGLADCFMPDGAVLNPRGFWGTMNTRGASNVNGDGHQPFYDTAGSTAAPLCPAGSSRSCYDPKTYYNYAVEMPPNSTGGYVYVFDPGFCATANNRGTGDRWFSGSVAVSSWYELLNINDTPYNLADDIPVADSGTKFTNLRASDTTMGGPSASGGIVECKQKGTPYGDGRDYHDAWFLLNPGQPLTGGTNGTIYRLHTTGTDPADVNFTFPPPNQKTTDGEQSFALFVDATAPAGTSPRIYGLGAMQMFTPLSSSGGSTASEFYLAQIDGVHEGKTVEIQLWDPGDTAPLTANLQILVPAAGGVWSPTNLDYRAHTGTSNNAANSACNTNAHTNWPNIVTEATGSAPGEFNGCWLTISIIIPTGYGSACTDPVTGAPEACLDGWWKIRYNMTGNGTSNDVTTWKVTIRGNPVHLVLP